MLRERSALPLQMLLKLLQLYKIWRLRIRLKRKMSMTPFLRSLGEHKQLYSSCFEKQKHCFGLVVESQAEVLSTSDEQL